MALHFDVTGDNSNFLRKLEETKRGVAETAKFMESQGKKIDSSFNSVSFGDALKKQIHEGAQSVNGLTAQIIKQKSVIKDIEGDVRALGEAYRKAGAGTQKGNALFADFKSAKASLQEEKNALFGLQTEQAQARLSVRKLKDEYSLYQKEGQNVVDSNNNMALSFKKTLAAIGGIAAFKQLGSAIIEARAEMQQLEKSFEVLLGSKAKSDVFVKEMKDYALISPLSTTEVSKAAQTLLGFGVSAEKVIPTLKMIGDVSMGNSQRFSSLALAFAQVQAAGKLTGNDLLQLVNAGFNPLKIISEKTGKSMADLKKEMSDGSISADMVADAFKSATEEGGQFHGMIEKNANGIRNAQNVLQGAIQETLNKIGEQNEGLIKGGYEASTYLVENYRKIGSCVTALVGIYGTYRTALLINSVLELGSVKAVWAKVTATKAATLAQATYNKILAMNPYVAVGMAIVSLGLAIWALADHTTTAEKAQKRFNDALATQKQQLDNLKSSAIDLINTIKSETNTQYEKMEAYLKLQKIFPEVFKNMDIEKIKLMDLVTYEKLLAEAKTRREIVGAKTSLVLKTNAYSEAKERYSKTSSRNSNVLVYYAQMKAAEEDMKLAQKHVNDIEKIQSEANKQKKKEDIKPITQDKSYWEKQKKDAQSQLDALSDIEATGAKGLVLKDKIAGYEKKINKAFSTNTTKNESTSGNLQKEQEKYNLLLDKQKREEERMKTDSLHELEQIEINGLVEGSEKVLRQRKLNHDKELEAINREAQDNKLKAIEAARSAHESNPDKKKGAFDADKFVQSEPAKIQFASFDKTAEAKTKTENTKYNRGDDFKGLINEHQDYADKRLAIETKYNNDLAILDEQRKAAVKNGDTDQVEQIDRAIAQATKNKGKELMGKDYDKLKESPEYVRAFENLKETSSETLNSLLAQLENAKGAAAQVLSPDQLREYTTTIQEIMDELDSRNPWQALSDKKQELANAEEELAQAQVELENARQQAELVKGGAKIENGVSSSKFNSKTGKIDSTKAYLTEAQALDKVEEKTKNYSTAKDKVTKTNSKVKKSEEEVKAEIDELSKSISDVGAAIGGPAGEIISLIGDIGTFTMTAMSGVQAAADTSATAISTVEKASVILAIISAAFQIAMKIASLFNNDDEYQKEIEKLQGRIEQLQWELDNADAIRLQNNTFQALQKVKEVYAETTEEVLKLHAANGKYLNAFDRMFLRARSSNEILQKSAEKLALAYANIDYTADKALGTEKFSGAKEQLTNIAQQQLLIQEQIRNEDSKKKTDHGKIEDWERQIQELGEQANAIINEIVEGIIGGSAADIASELGDAFIEAFQSGENAAEAWGDKVDDIVANVLKRMLVSKYLEAPLGEIFDKYKSMWYKDGEFAGIDAIMESMGGFSNDLNAVGSEFQTIWDALPDNIKSMFAPDEKSTSQDSTKGMSQSMDQDTGNELNGRFTAFQESNEGIKISNEEIKNSMLSMLVSMSLISVSVNGNGVVLTEIRNLMISSNGYLEDIAKYTKPMLEFGAKLDKIESNTKGLTSR